MLFGERLSELRKDNGLKQKELADILGIGEDMLSKYERNVHNMPDELKMKVASYFNISLDYLIGVIDEQIAYDRKDAIILPIGFPEEELPTVKRWIKLLMLEHKSKN